MAQSNEYYEELVKQLYRPESVSKIGAIDEQLKSVQHTSQGWQLADFLLHSADSNVRFFGALTFQVRLNDDGSQLDAGTADSILGKLLHWTVRLQTTGEQNANIKKILSVLATYYIKSSQRWPRPILHLAASFKHGDTFPSAALPENDTTALKALLPSLDDLQILTLIWLSNTLANEVHKVDGKTATVTQVHAEMVSIMISTNTLLEHSLTRQDSAHTARLRAATVACFASWAIYAQPRWSTNVDALQSLRSLIPALIPLLTDRNAGNDTLDAFRDILESYGSLLLPEHLEKLADVISNYIQHRMLRELHEGVPEVITVAQFVSAYGMAIIQQMVTDPENQYCVMIYKLHFAILEGPGYPGEDDEVSINSVEFWNTYIEYVNDLAAETDAPESPSWLKHSKTVCARLVQLLLAKIRTPPPELAQAWDDDDDESFRAFRMDATDLMLSIFQLLGDQMTETFISITIHSMQSRDWIGAEAAMYCLNKLSDSIMSQTDAEGMLAQIFASSLFRDVADFSLEVPTQARRTAIDMLGAYGEYMKLHAEFLPDTLRFLFASLSNPDFSNTAARAIGDLCSTCRESLTGDLGGFIRHYQNFARDNPNEYYMNEKVMGAVASIVQAITPEDAKAAPLLALLDIVDESISRATLAATNGEHDSAHEIGLSALKSLEQSGRGLQAPDDVLVDLTDADAPSTMPNFWRSPEGQAVQLRILNCCYAIIRLLPASGDTIDGFCAVLKTGFPETQPGPFVFPPEVILNFIEQCSVNTPRLEVVLTMTATFVLQSRREKRQQHTDSLIHRVYVKIVEFMSSLGSPRCDEPIASNCIEVLIRLFGGFEHILLDLEDSAGDRVRISLDFALESLMTLELLPKRSAADFWTKFIRLTMPSANHSHIFTRANEAVTHYGPLLCQNLMLQVTGQAQRSELDQLCAPLGALIQAQLHAKQWIFDALSKAEIAAQINTAVDEAQVRRFVETVAKLRGDARTKGVVKGFWAACRGTVESFSL